MPPTPPAQVCCPSWHRFVPFANSQSCIKAIARSYSSDTRVLRAAGRGHLEHVTLDVLGSLGQSREGRHPLCFKCLESSCVLLRLPSLQQVGTAWTLLPWQRASRVPRCDARDRPAGRPGSAVANMMCARCRSFDNCHCPHRVHCGQLTGILAFVPGRRLFLPPCL